MFSKKDIFFVVGGVLGAAAWQVSTIMLRRRVPDPPDPPSNYGLAYEDVSFASRDGIPLRGWWIKPEQPNGAALIICHGHNGSMDGDTGQAARLAGAGYHVLMFNLRAHGTSGGHQVTFGAKEHLDVFGAINWVEAARGFERVGLVGFSMGAGVVLVTAALDERVAAVVADGTISHVRDALVGLARTKGIPEPVMRFPAALILMVASLRARTPIPKADPARWASQVGCPVLFIHGMKDPFTTVEGVGLLAARTPNGQLWLVPDAGHRDAYHREPEAYYERVIRFLDNTLAGKGTL